MNSMNHLQRKWGVLSLVVFLALCPLVVAQTATISGTVTGPDGTTGLPDIDVAAFYWNGDWWEEVTWAYTDFSGAYELEGLEAGIYRVRFADWTGNYVSEIYDNVIGDSPWQGGMNISVASGAMVSGINASLAVASKITGTVTAADGETGLSNIYVGAWRSTGSWWEELTHTYTDESGNYVLGGLIAGEYRVVFSDWNDIYVSEIYDDVIGEYPWHAGWQDGMDISVGPEATVSGINASLAEASKITGTVTGPDGTTGLEGVGVDAYRLAGTGWEFASYAYTDEDGYYEIGGLAAGIYRVTFNDWNGNYVGEIFDNVPADYPGQGGTDLAVATGETVSNINAALDEYASLSGTVTQSDATTPLPGVKVRLFSMGAGEEQWNWGETDIDGNFTVYGLRPGAYAVRATPRSSSGYLGQWYAGILYIPGENGIPPDATPVSFVSGEEKTGVDFALVEGARLTGTVTGAGMPVSHARMKAKCHTYDWIQEGATGESGTYAIVGLLPGTYTFKAGAAKFKDEWWSEANHEDQAAAFTLGLGETRNFDFDLLPGQSPALVEVISDPSGASIYLDYQATPYVTPTVLDIGEVASHALQLDGWRVASHVITLKKAGRPVPGPRFVGGVEAETVEMLIDMAADAAGSISIATEPDGAEVYVNFADIPAGLSPVVVGNLAPGSHTILLRKPGYLQPRPIVAWVVADATTAVDLPLASDMQGDRIMANIQSVPTNARVYVDYLPTIEVTDVVVDWLDPASHAGSGWHSASHTILLRRPGSMPGAPRVVPDVVGEVQGSVIELEVDEASLQDCSGDGIPDWWWALYGYDPCNPPDADSKDGSGMSYRDKLWAGLVPGDPDSRLAMDGAAVGVGAGGRTLTFVFDSVPGRRYMVQGSDKLGDEAQWLPLGGIILATGIQTTHSVQIPEDASLGFYRLLVLVP